MYILLDSLSSLTLITNNLTEDLNQIWGYLSILTISRCIKSFTEAPSGSCNGRPIDLACSLSQSVHSHPNELMFAASVGLAPILWTLRLSLYSVSAARKSHHYSKKLMGKTSYRTHRYFQLYRALCKAWPLAPSKRRYGPGSRICGFALSYGWPEVKR